MSLPGLIAQPLMAVTSMNPIENVLSVFNTNPYFIGLMMLMLNLGGRFLGMEITKEQEKFFQMPWVRRFLIFTVLFVATRNIWVALIMSVFVIVILGYLFNENSGLCIYKDGYPGSKCSKNNDKGKENVQKPGLTPEEQEILRRLHEKNLRYSQETIDTSSQKKDIDPSKVYMTNMNILNGMRG
jgi:hypothetical protein